MGLENLTNEEIERHSRQLGNQLWREIDTHRMDALEVVVYEVMDDFIEHVKDNEDYYEDWELNTATIAYMSTILRTVLDATVPPAYKGIVLRALLKDTEGK